MVEPSDDRCWAAGIEFYAVAPAQASAWEVFLAKLPASAIVGDDEARILDDEIEILDEDIETLDDEPSHAV